MNSVNVSNDMQVLNTSNCSLLLALDALSAFDRDKVNEGLRGRRLTPNSFAFPTVANKPPGYYTPTLGWNNMPSELYG